MGKRMDRRWGIALLKACVLSGGVFCLRRGWNHPLLGFADAFSIGGFLLVVLGSFCAVNSDAFDGFAYAFRWALGGVFPAWATSYSAFKRAREKRRLWQGGGADGREKGRVAEEKATPFSREERWMGVAFLLVGLGLCVFFL